MFSLYSLTQSLNSLRGLLRGLFNGPQSGTPKTSDYKVTPVPDMPDAFTISACDTNGEVSPNGTIVFACSKESAFHHPAPRS